MVAFNPCTFQWCASLFLIHTRARTLHFHGAIFRTNTYIHNFYYANLHAETDAQHTHFYICISYKCGGLERTMTIRRHKSNIFGSSIRSHFMFRRVKSKTKIYKYYKLSVRILNIGLFVDESYACWINHCCSCCCYAKTHTQVLEFELNRIELRRNGCDSIG